MAAATVLSAFAPSWLLPAHADMFLQQGTIFTHETVREWESKLALLLSETQRKPRSRGVGKSWYVDETSVEVQGQWCYRYRAIDRGGNLVDVRLSVTRNLTAAESFFCSAWTVRGVTPDRITTDGHDAYPRAMRAVFGERVTHRHAARGNRCEGAWVAEIEHHVGIARQGS